MSEQDTIERAALAYVNFVRAEKGFPLVASLDGFRPEDRAGYIAHVTAVISALRPGLFRAGGMVAEQAGAIEAVRTGLRLSGIGAAFRHKKTGGIYYVCGECLIEAAATPAILYRSETGAVWCRPKDEFYDGRFDPLPAPPKEGK